jgi:hypothetical protein
LKDLDGNILLTQQKMNNPNKPREQKRFFASDFLKVNKEDIPDDVVKVDDKNHVQRDGFDIHQALKLNVITDAETEAKKPKPPKKVRIKKEPVPVIPSSRPTRTRKANSLYKDFVETDDNDNVIKVLGTGFVLVGGIKHYL